MCGKGEQQMDFVVIGGDAAGMSAASRARRSRPEITVTVFEKSRDVSYSACGMPYNIADPDRPMDDLVVRRAEVFRDQQGIDVRLGHCVERIDPLEHTVSGTDAAGEPFQKRFDKLLVATGASAVVPEFPGVHLPGVFALKSLEDGRILKEWIAGKPVRRAVILGMGYIALEMVEAFCARGIAVEMVKPGPVFLPWMPPDLSERVRETVEKYGVRLHPGCPVRHLERDPEGLAVVTDDGILKADVVLVAVGVTPNSRLAAEAGLRLGPQNAIAVDSALRTSDPDIFAAGDCADAIHIVTGRRVYIPLALRANRAGWAAADTVCGKETRLPGIAGTAVFKVFDLEVARTGLNVQEAEAAGFQPASVTIQSRSRAHAHPGASTLWVHMVGDKASGRLLGVQMVGKEGVAHRINAPAVALQAHMAVADFCQCDLAYAPPFSPVWDPMLTAANQLLKALS